MRLLSVRPDHERGRSVEAESAPQSRRDPRADERAYLPLRHLSAHFTCHRTRIAGDLSYEPDVLSEDRIFAPWFHDRDRGADIRRRGWTRKIWARCHRGA